ncbi:MBOAT family protein [Aestuariibaculum sp. M13]|uniref:MBOAT family O-acyltransferase n=1 Tax=Aestuariibaculum sp. M13 TaxID=2967132 RepID=UPI00215A0A51|nr:MBOAT family O-acyltransferase [Aestuariibaculum sp. M13]MCR8666355.1 MBOAT family protein [Aestuariibaculum sp. M13]
MVFNSLIFTVYLPLVFILYWGFFKKSLAWQNSLLLCASYVFYGWWDWRFLSLILFSTLLDYGIAIQLSKAKEFRNRKRYLILSLILNLSLLGFFKYYNFFVDNWIKAWGLLGVSMSHDTMSIILPVGISFYTFQTLSYTIDVYRNRVKASTNIIQFAAYVSFFPQLVAGPIERAKEFLPQFQVIRKFNAKFALSGVNLMVWGLFKKVVVADNCAFLVNSIFSHSENYNSMTLFLGAVLFSLQIYGDFSGYSDMAIGISRLFGFRLMTNFKFPYFSRNIAEFWRRWHISLSTWFRDYLYIPMGGSKGSFWKRIRNVFVVFLVSGFWHGANWTFLAWGGVHVLLFLPLFAVQKHKTNIETSRFSIMQVFNIVSTFCLVTLAWVFFRSDTIEKALEFMLDIFKFSGISLNYFISTPKLFLFSMIVVMSSAVLLLFEFFAVQNNQKELALSPIQVVFIGVLIVFMGVFKNPETFIYFQF